MTRARNRRAGLSITDVNCDQRDSIDARDGERRRYFWMEGFVVGELADPEAFARGLKQLKADHGVSLSLSGDWVAGATGSASSAAAAAS